MRISRIDPTGLNSKRVKQPNKWAGLLFDSDLSPLNYLTANDRALFLVSDPDAIAPMCDELGAVNRLQGPTMLACGDVGSKETVRLVEEFGAIRCQLIDVILVIDRVHAGAHAMNQKKGAFSQIKESIRGNNFPGPVIRSRLLKTCEASASFHSLCKEFVVV